MAHQVQSGAEELLSPVLVDGQLESGIARKHFGRQANGLTEAALTFQGNWSTDRGLAWERNQMYEVLGQWVRGTHLEGNSYLWWPRRRGTGTGVRVALQLPVPWILPLAGSAPHPS